MTRRVKIGGLAAIHRYPVKSMQGEELNAALLGNKGLQGDRAFALADVATGKIASAKNPAKWPDLFGFRAAYTQPLTGAARLPAARITLPDGSTVLSGDGDISDRLSGALGKPVRFLAHPATPGTLEEYWPDIQGLARRDVVTDEAMPPETFFDVGIVHLLTTATLDSLRAAYPGGRFETRRFRPNLVIATGIEAQGYPEHGWVDQVLSIGQEVRLKVTGDCGRCVMTTLAQADLPRDTGILKAAAQANQARVGIYASVLQGGSVRLGDTVHLEPA